MPGQRGRLAGDPLHQVAVAADGVDPIVEQRLARPIEALLQPALRHGHTDAVADPLPQRTGGGLDADRVAVLGVAGGDAAQLTKLLDVVQADRRRAVGPLDAGQEQQGVEQHRGMAVGEHEPVAVRPVRMVRIVAQEAPPEGVGHWRQAHRRAGVAGIGLLHRIDGQGADGVDDLGVDVAGRTHVCLGRRGDSGMGDRHGKLPLAHAPARRRFTGAGPDGRTDDSDPGSLIPTRRGV